MSTFTKEQLTKIIESAEQVITALAGINEDIHPEDSKKMCDAWDHLNDVAAPPEVVKRLAENTLAALTADRQLNTANLINKFYERYPLDTFSTDTERAAALGYFMAGAELQCFGRFIEYEGGE